MISQYMFTEPPRTGILLGLLRYYPSVTCNVLLLREINLTSVDLYPLRLGCVYFPIFELKK